MKATLDAVLAQTFRYSEVIISDTASTEATEEIFREYATRECALPETMRT